MRVQVDVPYGKTKARVSVDEKNLAGIINPNPVEVREELQTILNAVNTPINSKGFQEFLDGGDELLCIVNDGLRVTPTAKVLKVIYDRIKDKNVRFIVATGIHRAPTSEEYDFIFGEYRSRFRDGIFVHDANREEDMVYLGKTKFGTEVYVNKVVIEARNILIIGSVEPHYLAGYTGGRKAIVPGIAAYKTVEQNHKLALSPRAQPLALSGNPVHDDMVEGAEFYFRDRNVFSIMTVLDGQQNLYAATAGHVNDSFHEATKKADMVFSVEVEEKADVVVSVVQYPLDRDLYQSQKAREHGTLALKEGGILILVSECREGPGPQPFFELLSSAKTPEDILSKIKHEYRFGYHNVARLLSVLSWAQVWAVTSLRDEVVRKTSITPFHSVQEALDAAIRVKGSEAKVLFLMNGGLTVPRLAVKPTSPR